MPEQQTDVVKWYTRARRFPQLIGRTPDGTKLWGGPYTVTQAVGAGVVLFIGLNTMSLWASYGMVGNTLILGAVTVGTVVLLGRIPVGSRSPLSVGAGLLRATASPATGRLGGRAVRIRRPHALRHTVVLSLADLPEPSEASLEDAAVDVPETSADPVAVAESAQPRRRWAWPSYRPGGRAGAEAPTKTRLAPETASSAPQTAPEASVPRRPALTGVQALLAAPPAATRDRTTSKDSR